MANETLDQLTSEWQRLKAQKAHKTGGVEGRVLTNLAFLSGDQYVNYKNMGLYPEPRDENKLYLMFDMIGPRVNKLLGRLSFFNPPYRVKPDKKDAKAIAKAETADKLVRALDQKLNEPAKVWERFWWLLTGGTCFEYVPWVPNATVEPAPQFNEAGEPLLINPLTEQIVTERDLAILAAQGEPIEGFELYEVAEPIGEVGSEILGPLNVFIDQSVKSVQELAPDQCVMIAKIRTTGWVAENFGVTIEGDNAVSLISSTFHNSDTSDIFLKDLIPLVQGSQGEDDPGMVTVVECYYPSSQEFPRGRYTVFIPGREVLYEGENPYEEIPLVDFHWKPVTINFWTPDYVSGLIAPQRFINKRLSQLGEQANATIYSHLLLGAGVSAEDINADEPSAIAGALSDTGAALVQRLSPPELPQWFMQSIQTAVQMFNDIAGGSDLFNEQRFPGQLRGPMAVPLLQEILDTEWGPFLRHMAERTAKVKKMRLNRVKGFYPPSRTLHYVDPDQKDEVLVFHTEEILRSDVEFDIQVEAGSVLPEFRALREQRLAERLAGPLAILYMDERTGRLDKNRIAAELDFGDSGRKSREEQYRKLALELIAMIRQGQPIPPVMPFWDHKSMMDEVESAMSTKEFLSASMPVQQGLSNLWNQHRQFLQMEAEAQQKAMQSGMIQSAVAQATQQAAATAAAEAVDSARDQIRAQGQVPTSRLVQAANQGVRPGNGPKKRRMIIEEEDRDDQGGPPVR